MTSKKQSKKVADKKLQTKKKPSKVARFDKPSKVARFDKPSKVQAVVFSKKYKTAEEKKWLKDNDFLKGKKLTNAKPHITSGGSKQYTIIEKSKFEKDKKGIVKLGFKKTNKGIYFLIGTLKS